MVSLPLASLVSTPSFAWLVLRLPPGVSSSCTWSVTCAQCNCALYGLATDGANSTRMRFFPLRSGDPSDWVVTQTEAAIWRSSNRTGTVSCLITCEATMMPLT